MKTEALIEQMAEMRALMVVNTFMMQTFLEQNGCDAATLLQSVDQMNTLLANDFEAGMRKACGLEPRPKPRKPVLPKLAEMDLIRSVDWNKVREV